jgi:hypothetical protein
VFIFALDTILRSWKSAINLTGENQQCFTWATLLLLCRLGAEQLEPPTCSATVWMKNLGILKQWQRADTIS